MADSMLTARLYNDYSGKVLRYISSRIHNQQDCEDLVSTVFLKVQQNISNFDEQKASASTWIFSITRNTVIDYYRTNRQQYELSENLSTADDICENLCNEENLELLAASLEELDERLRDLIILHYFSGLTLKDIAQKMQMSYSNAKVLHSKALDELKLQLKSKNIEI
ncbi:MAG: RNA polymerase sigma factor [Clostridiales bacterium]|nr:RNA polymerase sigma factor [Clostridiales bacterium]